MTMAYEDVNYKLVDVVTIANVDDEDRIGSSFFADLKAEVWS